MTDQKSPYHDPGISISDEMQKSYLDYAMSVIVSRALPDIRDGLKPVHRRILYAMMEGGYDWSKPYRKSARIVGDVMGNYHPHGDTAIYDSMVRMAQDFSMRVPLVDGQGNFGSVDGDPPAAMRYTESRLAAVAEHLLRDIDLGTVDFIPNYDETQEEPSVLPAEYPNLLVNGAGGIAVGMATNIPPHNPGEVLDACIAYVKNPAITLEEIMAIVPGPDFPTGGIIAGREGIRNAFATGRGSIPMRARVEIEDAGERQRIVISELPYQVNKALLQERIGELVKEKVIEGIAAIRDESDRRGMRVVIDLKRDAQADVVLNRLYRHTKMQSSFPVNLLVLNGGRPEQMGLREVIAAFCAFRTEVVTRRTRHRLGKARDRAHILAGLMVALTSIDEVIELIRKAPDADTARRELTARVWPAGEVAQFIALIDEPGHRVAEDDTYRLSERQARAILELRLQRLTGMERDKLAAEMQELADDINDYLLILSDRARLTEVILEEFAATRKVMNDPRRTQITDAAAEHDEEAMIAQEDMVVTVSHRGYIKRVPLSVYNAQRRGGKGRRGMSTRDEDFVSRIFVANTHSSILFFTNRGKAYQLKCHLLPESSPQAQGKAMVNMLPIEPEETIQTIMPLPDDQSQWEEMNMVFATAKGNFRRNRLADFTKIRSSGIIAMKLDEDDSLISVQPCHSDDEIIMATRLGRANRFKVEAVRVFSGRASSGLRGIRLREGDSVISMSVLSDPENQLLLTVTENGYGKRTKAADYTIRNRGGQGVINVKISETNGPVVACFPVTDDDQLMLATNGGKVIRIRVQAGKNDTISSMGRNTRGVRLFDIEEGEKLVSAGVFRDTPDGEADGNGDGDDSAPPAADDGGDSGDENRAGATPAIADNGESNAGSGGDDETPEGGEGA